MGRLPREGILYHHTQPLRLHPPPRPCTSLLHLPTSHLLPFPLQLCMLYPHVLPPSPDGSPSPALFSGILTAPPPASCLFATLPSAQASTTQGFISVQTTADSTFFSPYYFFFYEYQLWPFNSFWIFLHEKAIVTSN